MATGLSKLSPPLVSDPCHQLRRVARPPGEKSTYVPFQIIHPCDENYQAIEVGFPISSVHPVPSVQPQSAKESDSPAGSND